MAKPVILDMDPGIDDAAAIAVAVNRPDLDVKLITAVAGNVSVEKTTNNSLKLLEFFDRTDIPVAQGAKAPLKREFKDASYIHGESGMPGYDFPEVTTKPLAIDAVEAIHQVLNESAEPITIIGTGAYTNLALLLQQHPEDKPLIKEFILMGGSISGGNVSSVAEFNVFTDPDAAAIVFKSELPITMIGLDVTLNALLTEESTNTLREMGPAGEMLYGIVTAYEDVHVGGKPMHDVNTILYAVDPSVIETKPFAVDVVTEGPAIGATVADFQYRWHEPGYTNVNVGVGINAEAFNTWFLEQVAAMNKQRLEKPMARKKMILDLDTGVDDALAIAYALTTPDADLIGIAASYGNTLVDTAAENSLKLLELLGATDVPVYRGFSHSSTTDGFETMEISMDIHGKNGIGDVELAAAARPVETTPAVDFMIESAHAYQDNLIIVPTGPLTNLAAAMQKDPEIIDLIGNITLMGGALTVPGNVTPYTEANINQDPEAADYVYKHAKHLVMVGLDVTMQTLLTKKETQEWRDLGTEKGRVFADIFDYYIEAYDRLDIDKRGAALHDPLAVGVAVDPKLVTLLPINMMVTHEDGRTIGDPERALDPVKTDFAAVEVDTADYLDRFMNYTNQILG